MTDWNDGYVTDITYTTGYYRETAPIWIATAATLLGCGSPDLTRPFCFADLGCGNGVTALVVAATMPHADVWGFDFNPAHVDAGRDIARRAGLSNIHFEEVSFEQLAQLPRDALPMFDYIVTHGVLSWISLENRRHLYTAIGQRLTPGGIAYVSYNVPTGWIGMPPIRTLMRLLTEANPERTDLAAASVFETLERMKNAGAAMFQAHPAIDARLALLRGHDQRYVAHEMLNRDWHPVMFQTVASGLAGIKCDYIGSATLQDNLASLTVPAGLHDMLGKVRDTTTRETLRDLACAAAFRRDLYQRGPHRLGPIEQERHFDRIRLVRTFMPVPEPLVLDTPLGKFTLNDPVYASLLKALETGPHTIAQLRRQKSMADASLMSLREAVVLLLSAGYLAPVMPETPAPAAVAAASRLNQVHAAMFDVGIDLPFLAYASLGAALHTDPIDILTVDTLRTIPMRDVPEALTTRLIRTGRQLHQDGQPITDPSAMRAKVNTVLDEFERQRLPAMRRLGVLDDPPDMFEDR